MKIIETNFELCLSCMNEHNVHKVEIPQELNGYKWNDKYKWCEDTDDLITYDDTLTENYDNFVRAMKNKEG